jgi:hypothetical protein
MIQRKFEETVFYIKCSLNALFGLGVLNKGLSNFQMRHAAITTIRYSLKSRWTHHEHNPFYGVTIDNTRRCNDESIAREPRPQRNTNPSALISDSVPDVRGQAVFQAIHPSPEI